jgi:signal transduction histidine kinase
VLWVALHGTRRELVAAVAGLALTLLLPVALAGEPSYGPVEWRRGAVSAMVALLLGIGVQHVVALARSRAAELAERARALRESEEQQHLILATAGEGIIGVDGAGLVTFANPAAAALTGHPAGALVGRPLGELLVDAAPDGPSAVMRRADGSWFPVERVLRPLRRRGRLDGAVLTFSDVTERRRAERALAQEREFLAAVLANLREGVVACGPDGRLRLFNEAAERLHGAGDPGAGMAPDTMVLARALAGEVVRDAEVTLSGDGADRRVVLANAQAIADADGIPLGAVATLHDVTERRHAERAKDEFFALVSHELRTPLTSIVGYLEVLVEEDAEDDLLTPHQRRFLATIARNAQRLERLVGDLLFVAQLEAGTLTLDAGEADLAALAREARDAALPRAVGQGVSLAVQAGTAVPCPGDAGRLGQVLDNLVSNAVKFTPAGGRVTVRTGREGDRAWFEVADTGVGIPAGELGRLFERFFRASTATDAEVPGIGLGLAISKAIVDGHGGRIAVTSTEGRGTTFRVELPAAAVLAEAA